MNFRLRFKEDNPMAFKLRNNHLCASRTWIHFEKVAEVACSVMWHEMATRTSLRDNCKTLPDSANLYA